MLVVYRRTLADLPPPSTDIFALHAPWCPIPARVLTKTLNIDHGLLGVWRMRGLGPQALPAEWTKGHRHAYRIDAVLAWLADRQGTPFDTRDCWLDYLRTNLGEEFATLEWVQRLAQGAGPVQGDVRFTAAGWKAYLSALVDADRFDGKNIDI